ncbi:putative transmembrane protein [Cavenderia fasciculata]|uniref:Transmembrane protein n=1 Tax=Cavenderia fasciculata TaxID=261658 RepID=F4Q2N4_CACFS|nr:putative transmembrane protein [Cavenderia fasciculata]EGG17501.1 putative transmembrane protein [Cavenderia fasciculata]|eukprot:XP_004355985.1 putative transmembrane protein [Cavenderia fasciculata]
MNVFRLIGDMLHLVSILLLLFKIRADKSCAGKVYSISLKSQILFGIVFASRYLDLFTSFVSLYNTCMKLFFLCSSFYTIYLITTKYKFSYDKEHDNFRILFLIIPSFLLGCIFYDGDSNSNAFMEILWTFSVFLEAVAIFPQLFLLQRTGEVEAITSNYIICLGGYRAFYFLNWIVRIFTEREFKGALVMIAGIVQTILYCDFFYYYFKRNNNQKYINHHNHLETMATKKWIFYISTIVAYTYIINHYISTPIKNNNNMSSTKKQEVVKPPFWANLVAGGVAGIIGASTIFPMDMVKTRLQNQKINADGTRAYNGIIDCFSKIIRNEGGVRSLYRGLSANLIGITPEKALKLAVNDLLRTVLQGDRPHITLVQEVMAGAGAGFCQVVATNPMEIVKIRMQIGGEGGKRATLGEVVGELGIRGLYKGTAATLLRDVPFSMVYFSMYGRIKEYFTEPNGHIALPKILLSGIMAGSAAAAVSTPMDVIKTRVQVKPKPGDPTYTGIMDCINKTWKNEGPKAFAKGLLPRIMIISPLFGITLMIYEVQKMIFAKSQQQPK